MTKDEAKKYLAQVAKDTGLSEETVKGIEAALANDTFASKVADGFMLQADYTRSKQAVAAEKQKSEDEYKQKYDGLAKWATDHEMTIKQAQGIWEKYQKYVQNYGELDGTGGGNNGQQPLTLEQVTKLIEAKQQQLGAQVGSVLEGALLASTRHQRQFGEPLDVEQFSPAYAKARDANPELSIGQFYNLWTAPRLAEKQKAEYDAQLETDRKRIRQEEKEKLLATARAPVDSGPAEMGPGWANRRPEEKTLSRQELDQKAENAFTEAWHKAAEQTQTA